jgi:hypothetical protein
VEYPETAALVIGFVLLLLGLWGIEEAVISALHKKRFEETFGFKPPLKSDGGEGIRIMQVTVDPKLRELAEHLVSGENSLYNVEPKNRLERMRELRQERKRFSQNLRLVRRFGFKAGETTYDYTRRDSIEVSYVEERP